MKRMPMFLMLLLATALTDSQATVEAAAAARDAAVEDGLNARAGEAGHDALSEAEHAAARRHRSAA